MKTFAEFKKKSNSKSNNSSASIYGQDLSLRSFTSCFWSHFLRTVICSCRQQENMLILLPVAVSSSHLDKQSTRIRLFEKRNGRKSETKMMYLCQVGRGSLLSPRDLRTSSRVKKFSGASESFSKGRNLMHSTRGPT